MRQALRTRVISLIAATVALAGLAVVAPASRSAAASADQCTRPALQAAGDAYLTALTAHDPSAVSWAAGAKVTENANLVQPGTGLWQTAGPTSYRRISVDPDTCSAHLLAVLNDGSKPAIVGIRLRYAGTAITESETIAAHNGDYFIFSADGLIQSDSARTDTAWEAPVPAAQRSTREQLINIADNYFSMFGASTTAVDRFPYETDCDRWENGVRTTLGDCTFGVLSGTGDGTGNFITDRRYPFVDVEDGIVIGYVLFGSFLDFHMFKVVDGHVRLINAVVGSFGHTTSGW